MTTAQEGIISVAPWTFDLDDQGRDGLTRRLLFEVTGDHPLWGQEARVIGRSGANDDVVAILGDGRFAIVHLVWGAAPGDAMWPATAIFETASDLSDAMRAWSDEAGFLND